jgi:rhodanese-related sulfurtransferase
MKKLLAFATAALLAVTLYAGEFKNITISDLKTKMANGKVTLLDANGTESWQKGHIPGAIDFDANETKLAKLLPKDKSALVVAYCGNPMCRAYQAAAKAAEKLGYKNVQHLSAGIAGWKEAGEKTDTGK